MSNDQQNQNSKQLYAVFLGGALHGKSAALMAAGTPRHSVGIHEVVTGYHLVPKQNGALADGGHEQRYFYVADDILLHEVAGYVAQFWSMASPVPDA